MTSSNPLPGAKVIVGVDTHRDEHVAVAIDWLDARLGEYRLPTTSYGYKSLDCWAASLGEIIAFGIEGTGSYGAGLARYLASHGHTIIEVWDVLVALQVQHHIHAPHNERTAVTLVSQEAVILSDPHRLPRLSVQGAECEVDW